MEEVRIDKYLWSIRVYKTRTDATDACKGGKVRVNGSDIKPSKAVKVGDVVKVMVLDVDEKRHRISLTMKGIPADK